MVGAAPSAGASSHRLLMLAVTAGALFFLLIGQLQSTGMKIVFVDFAIAAPFDRHFEHARGYIGCQELFQLFDELFFRRGAGRILLELLTDPCCQRYVGQQLLAEDFLAQRLVGVGIAQT